MERFIQNEKQIDKTLWRFPPSCNCSPISCLYFPLAGEVARGHGRSYSLSPTPPAGKSQRRRSFVSSIRKLSLFRRQQGAETSEQQQQGSEFLN